jgi:hypothetical protein
MKLHTAKLSSHASHERQNNCTVREKLPTQTLKLTLPCTVSCCRLAAVLTIALDLLIIGLGVTG